MMKMPFMSSCKELTDTLAEGELESVYWHKRLLIRMHLAMCVHCNRFAGQLALIAKALREHWKPRARVHGYDAVKRRILSHLKGQGPNRC